MRFTLDKSTKKIAIMVKEFGTEKAIFMCFLLVLGKGIFLISNGDIYFGKFVSLR